jgi:hypothetical protein
MSADLNRILTRPFGLVLLLGLAICPNLAHSQSLDAIYANAKAEGALVLYTGGPTAPWDAAAKEFSARYPGIAVFVTGGFRNVLDKKTDAQLAASKLDVISG